jgi:nucleoside-diphosphate-sugar epimerase
MSARKAILVTGATGKQGGAVVDALLASALANEITIVGLTRSADSPPAKLLAAKGDNVQVLEGNLDDAESIFRRSSHRFWGVFSVQVCQSIRILRSIPAPQQRHAAMLPHHARTRTNTDR